MTAYPIDFKERKRRGARVKNFLLPVTLGLWFPVLFTQTVSAQWVNTNGPPGGNLTALAVSGSNTFAGTGGSGVFLSINNGTSWTAVNSGLTNPDISSLAVSGSNVFAGTGSSGVFLSTNNGTGWKAVNSGLTNLDVTALAVSGSNIFAGTYGGGVFLSINSGARWTAVNSGLTNLDVTALAVTGGNTLAGTNGGGVFLSINNGTSWTAVNSGFTSNYALMIKTLAVSGGNIFAGTSGVDVYESANNGTSWTAAGLGGINYIVTSFAASGGKIFAGTNGGGVFFSTNNGASWTAANSGLKGNYALNINALAVSDSNIFAGTVLTVWRAPLSSLGVGVLDNTQPKAVDPVNLRISSPSRTNPDIALAFSLPHSDKVMVAVYNLSGHEIASLVNQYLGQGPHSITWNTRNVASGCYTVRLQAGDNIYTKSVSIFR